MELDRKEVERRKLIMHALKEKKLAEAEVRRAKKKWHSKKEARYCYENVYYRGKVVAVERRTL